MNPDHGVMQHPWEFQAYKDVKSLKNENANVIP